METTRRLQNECQCWIVLIACGTGAAVHFPCHIEIDEEIPKSNRVLGDFFCDPEKVPVWDSGSSRRCSFFVLANYMMQSAHEGERGTAGTAICQDA